MDWLIELILWLPPGDTMHLQSLATVDVMFLVVFDFDVEIVRKIQDRV